MKTYLEIEHFVFEVVVLDKTLEISLVMMETAKFQTSLEIVFDYSDIAKFPLKPQRQHDKIPSQIQRIEQEGQPEAYRYWATGTDHFDFDLKPLLTRTFAINFSVSVQYDQSINHYF